MSTPFEFDPEKSRANEERHGIDFIEAQKLWSVLKVIIPARSTKGESRYFILGRLEDKVYAAIFTKRGENIRLISCHRADKRLERIYRRHHHDEKPQG